jgi:F0F1-type ATP synthase membrane subunit b/b'
MGGGSGLNDASVEPARAALLADARRRAQELLQQADVQAREQVAQARRDAEALIARAREEGLAAGRAQAAHDAGRERALARWEVLAAQRAAYDELRRRVRTEAMALRAQDGYQELLERLTTAARRDLGDEAEVEIDPPADGGIRARAGGRQVDYTLASLAERCVRDLGPAPARLWA